MTYKRIRGLLFKVFSPSIYELVASDDGSPIALVTIAFTGEWNIAVLLKRGATIYRGPFRTRDDAIDLIANRRAA